MNRSLRVIALRGALGGLMVAGGLFGAPAFARGHGHEVPGPAMNAHAKLEHTPTGTASLVWDKTSHQLTATLSLTGLAPNGSYTANIEQGTCDKGGTVLYPLTGVTSPTTVSNVMNPIPEHGWYVAVNQGTTMVACGDVRGAHHEGDKGHKGHLARQTGKGNTVQSGTEHASAKLGPTKDPNQDVHGEAHLHLKGGTLTADLHVNGLKSGATYPAEIGTGTCSTLGTTPLYTLKPLTQNAHGDWTSTTTESGVTSIPGGKWYVAVWSADHSDLLACGNVKSGDHD